LPVEESPGRCSFHFENIRHGIQQKQENPGAEASAPCVEISKLINVIERSNNLDYAGLTI
jgi:hypothetical protein